MHGGVWVPNYEVQQNRRIYALMSEYLTIRLLRKIDSLPYTLDSWNLTSQVFFTYTSF